MVDQGHDDGYFYGIYNWDVNIQFHGNRVVKV
jgi:hypothetical protein